MEKPSLTESLFNLKGRTALVTGGATGIGRIISETLAYFGANIILVSRKEHNIIKARNELLEAKPAGFVDVIVGDLSQEASIEELSSRVISRTDSLDILVNNSGVSWGEDFETFPYNAWNKVLSVNVTGLFYLTQKLLPLLVKGSSKNYPAKILNLGSVMGSSPYGDGAYSYSASKAAVHHLTKILAKELASKHITVNALAPGPFPSKMTAFAISSKPKLDAVSESIPLKRIGRFEDIAAATIYLCGAGGNYITGAIIPIDGGLHITTGSELFQESRQL